MFVDKDDRSVLNKTMGSFGIFGLFLLFGSVVLIQCQITVNQDETNKVDSLPLILQFLNDDIKATINYNSGKILHTQLKGDILEVDLLVSISCKKQNDQCNYESAECRGLLFAPPTGELQVLSVDCNPNTPIIEEPLALPVKAQPCTGCMTDINVNAEGVEPLVKSILQHVESENGKQYTLLEVLRVQQQVVNGVNVYLTVKIAPAICNSDTMECNRDPKEEDIYCVVKFFQEPGFEAPKNIISNNCTHTQSFIPTMRKFDSNDINSVSPGRVKVMAHDKNVEVKKVERTENDILNELMSQIIPLDKFDTTSKKYVELVQSNPVTMVESSSLHNLLDENGQPIIVSSTFQDVLATEDQPISLGTDVAGEQVFTPNNSALHQEDSSSLPSVDDSIRPSQSQVVESQGQTEMVSESSSLLSGSDAPITTIKQERTKRSLPGGKQPKNVDDPKIAEYLGETVNYMNNKLGGVENPLKINKVLSVTSQVVEGISYDIKVEIGSSCTNSENSLAECRSSPKICDVNVWSRPWLNSRVTTVNCEGEKLSFDALQSKEVRHKRSIPGGWSAVKIDDPRIKEHLGKVLTKVDSQTGRDSALKIKEIISAASQIVAGTNWDIKAEVVFPHCNKEDSECDKNSLEKICEFKFWEKLPDKNGMRELDNIKMNCDQEVGKKNKREIHMRRMKRSLVGGHSPLSSDDPRLTKHLEQLLPKLDSLSEKEHKLKVKKIISATTQVVAGTNWNIKAEIALSDCPKSDDKKSSDCGDNKESFETVCTFQFWEKLPDKNGVRDLDNVKINCDQGKLNYRSKRSLVGGHNPVSNSDPRLNQHLEKLLPTLSAQSGKEHKFKVKEILSATSQVVAGTNWNIKAKVVLSDCLKSDQEKSADCGENKDISETICVFKFWEKLPDKNGVRELDNINIMCDKPELNSKSKREALQRNVRSILVGGHNALPKDDPRLVKHLDKLLPKLDTQTDQDRKLKIQEILSASSQVVAGTNWNIKAKVVLSDCLKSTEKKSSGCNESNDSFQAICDFKFWEKLPDENGVRELANIQIECDKPKFTYKSKREVHVRKTRARLGGNSPVPTDDPILQNHLAQLLPKLDIRSEEPYKLKAREILSALTQSVAGNDWNIKAIVVLSDCLKSDYKKARYCNELSDTFETICVFKFWEKLPNKRGLRELDNIKINCELPKLNYRGKREVKRSLVGGYSPVSNDDSRLPKHLEKLLPKLESESGNERKLTVKEIISASSQVVAGTNWNIRAKIAVVNKNSDSFETVCDFKFWEKLPDKSGVRKLDNIQINCEEPKLSYKSKRDLNSRIKRAILGAYNSVPTDDPKILKHLQTLLPRLDFQSSKDYKLKMKKVLSASKQIVAGTNWKIKVLVVLSDCLKEEQKTPEECNENQEHFADVCTFKFWERLPDANGIRLIDNVQVTCDKTQSAKYDYHFHFEGFKQFERKYNKQYSSNNERLRRFSIYLENMDYIKQLNDNEQGTAKYGITRFADLTRDEFSKSLGYRSDLRSENEVDFQQAEIPDVKLPENFDWRDKNAVAEVKNQGSCGSCWAFSVTGNVEGQYAIKYGKVLEFSEQELVDCDKVDEGCNGGLMDNAYRQIEKLGGLEEEKDYPYEAEDEKCHFNKTMARVQLSGAVNISTDETDMAKWLVKNGPISIAINANAMQFYLGGVSHPWKFLCNPKSLDHGVLIVGFGTHTYPKFKKALPYWIVKNSWGKSWGEQGYYRVYRGDGTCGVNQTPSSAILK